MDKPKVHKPILAIGTFGLHILEHVSGQGKYFYVGTVPEQLAKQIGTEEELLEKFFLWIDSLPMPDKKECVSLLRNDIFVGYLNRISHWT